MCRAHWLLLERWKASCDVFTGMPAVVVPIGLEPTTGLPLSLQMVGPLKGEARLLAAAHVLERAAAAAAKKGGKGAMRPLADPAADAT